MARELRMRVQILVNGQEGREFRLDELLRRLLCDSRQRGGEEEGGQRAGVHHPPITEPIQNARRANGEGLKDVARQREGRFAKVSPCLRSISSRKWTLRKSTMRSTKPARN